MTINGRSKQTGAGMNSSPSRRTLNLGAGRAEHLPGAIRLDRVRSTKPDIVADLDRAGIPFRTSSLDHVGAFDVVEHVEDMVALVGEVHRVLRPGGVFQVTTPHFSCANAHTDPTHRRALGVHSFDYFVDGHPLSFYSAARFRTRTARIFFRGALLGRLLFQVARRYPDVYETRLAWIFPAWFLLFELEAVK